MKKYQGILSALIAVLVCLGFYQTVRAADETIPVYRMFNAALGNHFYSYNGEEQNDAANFYGYRAENIEFHVYRHQVQSGTPLYRLHNPDTGDHFYTVNNEERLRAMSQFGYQYEGTMGYIYSGQVDQARPLYRLWNRFANDHFYTISEQERDRARNLYRYTYDGVAGYVHEPVQEKQREVFHYYYYEGADKQYSHGQVTGDPRAFVALKRVIPVTNTPIQDTIRLLIQNRLTERERVAGYSTQFPGPGFELIGANLSNGVLTLEFRDPNNFTSGGSLRVKIMRMQIEATAKQFPEVKQVEIIPEELFQP